MGDSDLGGVGVEFWRAEAERWRAEAERLAADDVVLRARVADLEGQVGALAEKVSVLARLAFGKSSEKAKPSPVGEDTGDPQAGDSPGGQAKRGRRPRRGSGRHGRRDYSHLPTREEIHDVPPGAVHPRRCWGWMRPGSAGRAGCLPVLIPTAGSGGCALSAPA